MKDDTINPMAYASDNTEGERMKMELCCCTSVLLDEIKDKQFKRKNVAQTYRLALESSEATDWKEVNKAIIDRWSMAGLKYIKEMAWSGKCLLEIKERE